MTAPPAGTKLPPGQALTCEGDRRVRDQSYYSEQPVDIGSVNTQTLTHP